jgi:hypothetical protein
MEPRIKRHAIIKTQNTKLIMGPRRMPDTKAHWPTDRRPYIKLNLEPRFVYTVATRQGSRRISTNSEAHFANVSVEEPTKYIKVKNG